MAIGFYIAAIVLIFGVTLVLAGLISSGQQAQGNVGFNINLWWGMVMVVSGRVILGMTLASPRRRAPWQARDHALEALRNSVSRVPAPRTTATRSSAGHGSGRAV